MKIKRVKSKVINLLMVFMMMLTMNITPVFASEVGLNEFDIDYHQHILFEINGQEYKMSDLMKSENLDFSDVDEYTTVSAKIDIHSINQKLKEQGQPEVGLHGKSFLISTIDNTEYRYYFNKNSEDCYDIINENGNDMTLKEFANLKKVALYFEDMNDTGDFLFGIDESKNNLFSINLVKETHAEAVFHYVDSNKQEYMTLYYVSEQTGPEGTTIFVNYKDLFMPEGLVYADEEGAGVTLTFGKEGQEYFVVVNKLKTKFKSLRLTMNEAVATLKNSYLYENESIKALQFAVDQGQAVLDKGQKALQCEVTNVENDIKEALNQLVYVKADYTALDEAVKKANELDSSLYTNFNLVADALEKVVYGLDITRQNQVDEMTQGIYDAINALEEKEPDIPLTPLEPSIEVIPFIPLTPSIKVIPLIPLEPSTEITPLIPLTPSIELIPLTPLNPSIEVTPLVPLTPSTPVIPFTPLTPSKSVNPIVPEVPTNESHKVNTPVTGTMEYVGMSMLMFVASGALLVWMKKKQLNNK